jgi:hypothetical protein
VHAHVRRGLHKHPLAGRQAGAVGDVEVAARVGRVVQDAGADHDIEGAPPEPGGVEVRFDELHAAHAETEGRVARQLQRWPRQIGADDSAVRAREEEAELPRSATHLQHECISGDGLVEGADEAAARGTGA